MRFLRQETEEGIENQKLCPCQPAAPAPSTLSALTILPTGWWCKLISAGIRISCAEHCSEKAVTIYQTRLLEFQCWYKEEHSSNKAENIQ